MFSIRYTYQGLGGEVWLHKHLCSNASKQRCATIPSSNRDTIVARLMRCCNRQNRLADHVPAYHPRDGMVVRTSGYGWCGASIPGTALPFSGAVYRSMPGLFCPSPSWWTSCQPTTLMSRTRMIAGGHTAASPRRSTTMISSRSSLGTLTCVARLRVRSGHRDRVPGSRRARLAGHLLGCCVPIFLTCSRTCTS
jgi:hypothetical protein